MTGVKTKLSCVKLRERRKRDKEKEKGGARFLFRLPQDVGQRGKKRMELEGSRRLGEEKPIRVVEGESIEGR